MRSLWVKIGLGASAVFVVGLFAISLGRHVKAQVTSAVRMGGGTIAVPFAMLPFKVGGERVGSVRQVDVRREYDGGPRRITIEVRLKELDAARFADCLFQADAPDHAGLFGCVAESSAEAADLIPIGEVRLEPGGLVRPIVISARHAGDWFQDTDVRRFHMRAGAGGVTLNARDADGARVEMVADSSGVRLDVRE
jgi:hypothetical protein